MITKNISITQTLGVTGVSPVLYMCIKLRNASKGFDMVMHDALMVVFQQWLADGLSTGLEHRS